MFGVVNKPPWTVCVSLYQKPQKDGSWPAMNWETGPQQTLNLLSPWTWTSRLQNYEIWIPVVCNNIQSVLVCSSSPRGPRHSCYQPPFIPPGFIWHISPVWFYLRQASDNLNLGSVIEDCTGVPVPVILTISHPSWLALMCLRKDCLE